MVIRKKLILLALFIIFYTITHAQYAGWMKGTWKSTGGNNPLWKCYRHTIHINDVSGESFTGTKTSEINGVKITISISGSFKGKGLYLQHGQVLHREGPENGQWYDCSACTQVNKMIISRDSLILVSSISGCDKRCDGETFFYRLLSEYDNRAQHYLVDWFGRPSDIIGFRPFHPQENKAVDSNNDNDSTAELIKKEEKRHQNSLDNIARIRQQQIDRSIRLAQQKKQEQEIADSLKLVQQKEQQRIKDSLNNIAILKQIRLRTEDSLRDVQAKNRQQEIADSLNLVKQKEQQRFKDSLDNVARIQQQTDDSTRLAQEKKRELEIADSLNIVKQREQRINDSLDNVARLEQIRKQTEDSLRNVQIKKREQEVADSLSLVDKRKQQHITDSLATVLGKDNIMILCKKQFCKNCPFTNYRQ